MLTHFTHELLNTPLIAFNYVHGLESGFIIDNKNGKKEHLTYSIPDSLIRVLDVTRRMDYWWKNIAA